jgi:type IV pilus assembly protein PilE
VTPIPRRNRRLAPARASGGYTLLETMMVTAIAGILAALAVPSYSEHVTRGKIAEATSNLAQLRARAEQHYLQHRDYAGFTLPPVSDAKYFTYSLSATATGYTITATGVAAQGMGGFGYAVSRGNQRITTALPEGWSGVRSPCWVVGRGGAC